MNTQRTSGGSVTVALPKYELIDKDGIPVHMKTPDGIMNRRPVFSSTIDAANYAKMLWPDQEQDPERTGKGWDVQVVGAGR